MNKILLVLLVVMFLVVPVASAKATFSPSGLYACMSDNEATPNQDGSYPPEGYHCRPHDVPTIGISTVTTVHHAHTSVTVTPHTDNNQPPATNSCKNKNSGKDGTPSECNAGKGQEKKN